MNATSTSRDPFPLATVVGILLIHFIVVCVLVFELVKNAPVFEQLFETYDLILPKITRDLQGWSQFVVKYWSAVALAAIIVDGAVVLTLARLPRPQRWLMSAYSHVILIGTVLLLAFMSMCWAMPAVSLTVLLAEQNEAAIVEDSGQ